MSDHRTDRRQIIGAGILLAGAGVAASCAKGAKGETEASGAWQPAMEQQDVWLDKAGTRHRVVYDSVSGDGGGEALNFANNFIKENELGYNLKPDQLGVVVVLRHFATPYAYNDAMWTKYGKGFLAPMGLKDEMAKRSSAGNPLMTKSAPGPAWPPGFEWFGDANLTSLTSRGVQYAVCGLATQVIAGMLVQGMGGDAKEIDAELRANLIPGATIVAAGVVGANRAQEHGYTYTYVG